MRIPARVRATMAPPLRPLMERAAARRREGRELFMLAQAMVDCPPPPAFTRALADALRAGDPAMHRYAPDPGTAELRRALAAHLAGSFGLAPDPERELLVTPGANQAAYQLLSVLLDPGDEALLVTPWYFNHEMAIRLLGGRARTAPAEAASGFVPSIESLLAAWTPRLRLLVLVSPNNPTGARYPDDWLRALAGAIAGDERWRGVWILCDQTYQELYFEGGPPLSLGALPELSGRVLTVGSFSKSFALAGWRLGFLCGPAGVLDQALKVQDSSVICAPHAAQIALAHVLDAREEAEAYLATSRERLRRRRDALLAPLREAGRWELNVPGGACFAFVGLPGGASSASRLAAAASTAAPATAAPAIAASEPAGAQPGAAAAFAGSLLEAEGVAVVTGEVFGPRWSRFLRLGFGTESEERLSEAGRRIARHWAGM